MELEIAIKLISNGVDKNSSPQVWADLGAGKGLFTQALATLLSPSSSIYAIDKDENALSNTLGAADQIMVQKLVADFTLLEMDLNLLDGALMANSHHFVRDKVAFIKRLTTFLKPTGRLILVEYNTDSSNQWVPYPVSYSSLKTLSMATGFTTVRQIGHAPSRYNQRDIYAALLMR